MPRAAVAAAAVAEAGDGTGRKEVNITRRRHPRRGKSCERRAAEREQPICHTRYTRAVMP